MEEESYSSAIILIVIFLVRPSAFDKFPDMLLSALFLDVCYLTSPLATEAAASLF